MGFRYGFIFKDLTYSLHMETYEPYVFVVLITYTSGEYSDEPVYMRSHVKVVTSFTLKIEI